MHRIIGRQKANHRIGGAPLEGLQNGWGVVDAEIVCTFHDAFTNVWEIRPRLALVVLWTLRCRYTEEIRKKYETLGQFFEPLYASLDINHILTVFESLCLNLCSFF